MLLSYIAAIGFSFLSFASRRGGVCAFQTNHKKPNAGIVHPLTRLQWADEGFAGDSGLSFPSEENLLSVAALWDEAGHVAAKNLPIIPSPALSAEEVVTAIIRGLQYNDQPYQDSGLTRCYEFMDLRCKKMVTGLGNTKEQRTLAKFLKHGKTSPKITPILNAVSIELGDIKRIAGTPTRGEIATTIIHVKSKNDKKLSNPTPKQGLSEEEGDDDPVRQFVIRLEKQRRPPLQGVYMVTDFFDVASVMYRESRPFEND